MSSVAADSFVESLLARCRFPTHRTPVCVAWSGGPDSTALVVLAQAAGCAVSAVHVDHGLRPAAPDVPTVEALAARLGIPVRIERATLEDGPNLEARARDERRRLLPPGALLGHTLDDQAETVLLNLGRGAGPRGLAAMDPEARRPLLGLRRAETRDLCRRLELTVVDDPTNGDPRHRRNRVRLELLPLLADVFERDPAPLLARMADTQRAVVDLLDDHVAELDPTDTRTLRHQPRVVAAHALQRWLLEATGQHHPVDADTVERLLEVVHHRRRATEVAGGHRVERHDGRLVLVPGRSTADPARGRAAVRAR